MRGKDWAIEMVALPIIGDAYAEDWRDLLGNVQISLPDGNRQVFFPDLNDDACYAMFINVMPAVTEDYWQRVHKHQFRLLDDDGVVYAYGWSADDSSFAPLDWATSAWGCTSIEYWNGNEWEPL